ncbi:hypothetical protein PTSG_01841 [Salpingoeca rosetta]|uniref:Large ribosomal subunit protein uL29m n=1 Tax=Salpingoeca rosetta (strain ATCC 50818 / BSB-021) TaxID=946362 RepID=F2TZ39_SALR5|nr:uncharacterized protein PTSG_01841 [Salpingoeca rosetta]EGD78863.1 hypothetical protein PTSG_01841 [Salpingoeca rosetta]|eukprot:XP_004997819.1 hypothetical protein PTSG_01841 [Salpingoeca rosetta]
MMLLQRVVGGVGATAVAMGSRAMATLAVRGGGGVAGAMSRAYACRLCSTTTASRLRVQPRQLQQGQRAVPVLHAQTVRWASDTTSSGATSAAADEAFVMPEGLKKFFPEGAAWDEVDVGRRWKTRELRVKSNEDLHKLWYILLIERNKLLTVKLEARRIGEEMPGPLRLKKVKQAMDSIQLVLRERVSAQAHKFKN